MHDVSVQASTEPPHLHPFAPFWLSVDWLVPRPNGEKVALLLSLTVQMLFLLAILPQICPKTMFYKLSGIPFTSPSQYIKPNITISHKEYFQGLMDDISLTKHISLSNLSLECKIPPFNSLPGSKILKAINEKRWQMDEAVVTLGTKAKMKFAPWLMILMESCTYNTHVESYKKGCLDHIVLRNKCFSLVVEIMMRKCERIQWLHREKLPNRRERCSHWRENDDRNNGYSSHPVRRLCR